MGEISSQQGKCSILLQLVTIEWHNVLNIKIVLYHVYAFILGVVVRLIEQYDLR
jgi:hypothetical protein